MSLVTTTLHKCDECFKNELHVSNTVFFFLKKLSLQAFFVIFLHKKKEIIKNLFGTKFSD